MLRIDGPVRLRLGGLDDGAELRVEPDAEAVVRPARTATARGWWKLATTVAISVLTVLGAGLAFWAASSARGRWTATGSRSWRRSGPAAAGRRRHAGARRGLLAAAYRATLAEIDVLEGEAAQARRAGRRTRPPS